MSGAAPDTETVVPPEIGLAEGFEVLDRAAWAAMAADVLNKRRPPDRRLTGEQAEVRLRTTTLSGIAIDALYTRPQEARPLGRPGVMPFVRGSSVRSGAVDAWQVRQWHDDPDLARGHRAVLTDLERGATALWLQLGADAIAIDDLGSMLDGVLLDLAPVCVSSHDDQIGAARALMALWARAGLEGFTVQGALGVDRLGAVALGQGAPPRTEVLRLVRDCLGSYPSVRSLTVDATIHHEAGGGEVEELACAVATGVAYLRGLEEFGVSVTQTFSQIEFRVAATADQFLTIAKLRALRRMWARVGEVSGVPDVQRGARQHAVTTRRMLTRDDPWVNILRTTTACFGAAVGGAEAITVLPYDTIHGLPVESSRRIARNTQVLLAEESNLGRVTDPAGGGWYVEALTDALCERAWAWFQLLDADGGMEAALRDGRVVDRIAEVRDERDRRLATRRLPLTGVSMFPAATETPVDREPRVVLAPATTPILPPTRDAEVFERLRDRATAAAAQGSPATVLLACLGTRRDFGPRETFTSNLLHVAGIDTPLCEGGTPEQVAARLREVGAQVAVLCSSAGVYADQGVAVAEALRAAGVREVLIAGRRTELGPEAPPGAVDGELFDGMDVVTFLSTLLDTLGAPA
ncbi:methylmalonyl-CoA mutase family protein [Arsenicicoccus dermatophilus]|uniref:methylmalonyl-CoA mutase family protein n=1 Tax=Arsenicicoccus dermatophilus TaxID=1076331 RepID=UPI001F4D1A12|nr:methylmalonyl-CoA mutase family protein [Arsenicicoccus dermatophilus]MCH8614173.1 methylmalonyl-CoA mutase family protein [Arsenicicoccus dermatophilus]